MTYPSYPGWQTVFLLEMKLAIGLGNPPAQYASSRHNVGATVVETIAGALEENKKFQALVDNQKGVVFAIPLTFMNNSGSAVGKIASFYKIKPKDILIVRDDLDMTVGRVRGPIFGSSSAGHKGLASVTHALGTKDFWQLKMGIGRPVARELIDQFVLEKFKSDDKKLVEKGLAEMVKRVEKWVSQN